MRRLTLLLILLAMVLWMAVPARAQDDFTPEEQAAIDEIHAALEKLVGVGSYTAQVGQKLDQVITMTYLGQEVTVTQRVASSGTLLYADTPQNAYDNRHLDLTQSVTATVVSDNQTQESTVGPLRTQMIVIDDRVYIKMDVPSEMQSLVPEGWNDVTEGAEAIPGMALFDIQGMLKVGDTFTEAYLDSVFSSVAAVEILEPETIDGRTVNQYRLTLDAQMALEGIGAATFEGMFNEEQSPFDVAGYIELMFTDEDTTYVLDFAVYADDQTLYSYSEHITTDILIPASLITDPTLAGAEMAIAQNVTQTLQFSGLNEPVTIQAPE